MKLKFERQWEIAEKIFENFVLYDQQNGYRSSVAYWDTRKQIIQNVFNIDKYIDWNKLWSIFENDIFVLHFEDWEHQQKPFIDKMIEISLWNRNINYD